MCGKDGKAGMKYNANITSFEKNRRFAFIGKMMAAFLFSADRMIELENSGEGTLFSQKEAHTGLLVPLFWNKLNNQAAKMFKAEPLFSINPISLLFEKLSSCYIIGAMKNES